MAINEDPEEYEVAALDAMVPSFRGCRVLEVGCGDGRLTRRYALTTKSVLAIDRDEDAVAKLAGALSNVDARALGIDELALPPHSIDIVLFAWSL